MTASSAEPVSAAQPLPAKQVSRSGKRRLAMLGLFALAGAVGASGYVYYRHMRDPVEAASAQLDHGNAVAAALLLRTALQAHPDDARAQLLLGKANLRLDDPAAAERALHQAEALGATTASLRLPLATALLSQRRAADVMALLAQDGADPADAPRLLVVKARAAQQLNDQPAVDAALAEAGRLAPTLIDVPLAGAELAWQRRNVAAAEAQVGRALELDGRSSEALILKAHILERKGERPAALDLLGTALAAVPKDNVVRLERARILIASGHGSQAKGDVDAVLADKPADVTGNYLRAVLLTEDGDYIGADKLMQRLVRFLPRLPRGYYTAGLIKLHLEQYELAAEAADKYVAGVPGDMAGRKLVARVALAAGQPERALAAVAPVVTGQTTDSDLLDLLGLAEAKAGRLAAAEGSFGRAAALVPQNADVQAQLGAVRLRRGDMPGAVAALERSHALSPERLEIGEELVVAAVASGQPERAAAVLADVRQRAGDTAQIGRLDAVLALAQFDFAAATTDLAKVAATNPEDASVRVQLAQVLLMQGRMQEAEATLTSLLDAEPAQEQSLDVLVPLLERSGRRPQAIGLLERARAAAPANVGITVRLAAALTRGGEPAKVLAVFGNDAMQSDASPRLLLARAAAEAAVNQPAAARATYEGLLKTAPGNSEILTRYAGFLSAQGAQDEAGTVLTNAVGAQPGRLELQRALVAQRLRANGIEAALATADTLRRDPAQMPAATVLRGDALRAAGRTADAAAALQAEFAAAPSTALLLHTADAVAAAQGPVAAGRMLLAWTQLHPDDAAALSVLAAMQDAAKDHDGARATLERLLARTPNDPGAMNNLAWAYHESADPRAYPLALRAYLTTFDPASADTLGCILLSQSRTQDALTLLRFAGRALPDNLTVQLHIAQAQRQAGLRDEARTLLTALSQKQFDGRNTAAALLVDLGPAQASASRP